jgi:hypothetical protein
MSARDRMAGKLSVLSPGFDLGKGRWSAPGPTVGKLSVLSAGSAPSAYVLPGMRGRLAAAGPPPQAPAPLGWLAVGGALPHLPGLLGWLAADGALPHVPGLLDWLAVGGVLPHVPGLLGWLAAGGVLPHVAAPRGLLGWLAAGVPEASVALGPAGGTARKESVISQGGTPVFGRALPASGFAAARFAGPGSAAVRGVGSMLGGRP